MSSIASLTLTRDPPPTLWTRLARVQPVRPAAALVAATTSADEREVPRLLPCRRIVTGSPAAPPSGKSGGMPYRAADAARTL